MYSVLVNRQGHLTVASLIIELTKFRPTAGNKNIELNRKHLKGPPYEDFAVLGEFSAKIIT